MPRKQPVFIVERHYNPHPDPKRLALAFKAVLDYKGGDGVGKSQAAGPAVAAKQEA